MNLRLGLIQKVHELTGLFTRPDIQMTQKCLPYLPQRDLAALNNKIKLLSQECERLCTTYPESSTRIRGKEREVVKAWEALLSRSKAREDKLVEAEQLQRFLNTFRNLR